MEPGGGPSAAVRARPCSLRVRVEDLLRQWERERSGLFSARDDPTVPLRLREACALAAEELGFRIDQVEDVLYDRPLLGG